MSKSPQDSKRRIVPAPGEERKTALEVEKTHEQMQMNVVKERI